MNIEDKKQNKMAIGHLLEQDYWSKIRGFNYQPSYGSSDIEIWLDKFDAQTIKCELGLGKKYFPKMNSIRLWGTHNPFFKEPKQFMRNFETVLSICDELEIKVIPMLFNDWHSFPDYGGVSVELINYWFKNYGKMGEAHNYVFKPYLEMMFGSYASDKRIIAWDMCNEPYCNGGEVYLDWLRHTYKTGKCLGVKQPISVGLNENMEQLQACEDFSDVFMVHTYKTSTKTIETVLKFARENGKGVVATECCWGSMDDAERVKAVNSDISTLYSHRVGFMPHALQESLAGDLHRPQFAPHGVISDASYMAFVNMDGIIRSGHDAYNIYCKQQSVDNETILAAIGWLESMSTDMIRKSEVRMKNGISAFPPQVASHYNAFWLRDYAYMLEGNIGAFSDKELRDSLLLFVKSIDSKGNATDCILYDGTPVYMPGGGTIGENPVADGSQFTVDVAWLTYKHTGDRELIEMVIDDLVKCMNIVPRTKENGLVYIVPGQEIDCAPYGFTDTIKKQGNVLFCSLLFVQATRQLADLLEGVGRNDDAKYWSEEAERISSNIRDVFWNEESSLFHAATDRCNQPDIWGSAFAVFIGVATQDQSEKIARYFKKHYNEIIYRGQLRHLPGGKYWEDEKPEVDMYQNGGYWGTPVGWFCYTLDIVDSSLADRTFMDMVHDYRLNGIYENVYGENYYIEDYNASAALPLDGIRKMLAKRK